MSAAPISHSNDVLALCARSRRPRVSAIALGHLAAIASGVAVFVFLTTHSLAPFFASLPAAGSSESQFRQQLDQSTPRILRHYSVPGVVIATVVDGAPSHTYAYGLADVASRRPMTADTVFRVASISKSLTAWGVLHLVGKGKVALDAPVERYLPAWPLGRSTFPSSAVTVRRLLNHTAGVNAADDTFRRPDQPALSPLALLRQEGGAAQGPASLVQPAGKSFLYSAPGYTILQMLIEHQSQRPFADYMKEVVLRPLGMTSSSFEWDPALRSRTATPYLDDGRASAVLIPQDAAADSLFATAPDLARFVAAPLPDRQLPAGAGVLSVDMVDHLYRPVERTPNRETPGLGPDIPTLGCFIENLGGHRQVVTNSGGDPGWVSRFYIAPATGDGIVILTNSDRGGPAIAQIANIWARWKGLPPSNVTRAYRMLGIEGAAVIALLTILGVSFAIGLVFDIGAGARRFGAVSLATVTASAVEILLVTSVVSVWMYAYESVKLMPVFYAVGLGSIGLLILTVLARITFPVVPTGSTRTAALRLFSPVRRMAQGASPG